MGDVVRAKQVIYPGLPPKKARNLIWFLAGSMALMMTGSNLSLYSGVCIKMKLRLLKEAKKSVGNFDYGHAYRYVVMKF